MTTTQTVSFLFLSFGQFWYTDECADEMALEIVEAAIARADAAAAAAASSSSSSSSSTPAPSKSLIRIACISAPSAFKGLKRLNHPRVQPFVFEYDRRFAAYGPEFVFYDFNHPADLQSTYSDEELGGPLRKSFDGIIADPPYLNEECMGLTGETIRLLAKVRIEG